MVSMLALPLWGWGQQPIAFDTVQLNPISSFLVGHSVFETDSGYVVFGIGGDGSGDVQDQRSFRFDSNGGLLETKVFTNTRLTDAGPFSPVTRCASGGFASGVSAFGNGIVIDSLYLFRYGEIGDTLWTRFLIADTTLAVRNCMESSTGDLIVVGFHEYPRGGFFFRTTAQGDSIRFVNFGYPAFYALSVVEDTDSNLIIAGYTDNADPNLNLNAYLTKCTPEGEVVWWTIRPPRSSYTQAILTQGGDILAFGGLKNELDHSAALVALYSSDGDEIWSHEDIITADNITRHCAFTDGFELSDGTFILCGSLRNYAMGLNDKGMLYHLDANGEVIWSRFYSHYAGLPLGNPQYFNDVEPTRDGGFILTGETWGPSPPNPSRLWLLKLDSMGCLIPGCNTVGVEEFESQLQSALRLSPNPASTRVHLELPLPDGYRLAGSVQAIVLDAQGKEVLRNTIANTGIGLNGNLDVSALPGGMYFLHLRDGEKWLAGGKVVVE